MKHASPVLIALLVLTGCGSPAADMPFGTAQQMMANEVQPTADIYWGAVRFESELMEDGTVEERDIRPETDAEWQAVADAAARLGELGNALLSPGYAQGRSESWNAYAQGLVDAAAQAEAAAVAHDPDAVFTEGGTVYNVCRACHQAFPPEELESEGMTVDELGQG